jgi:hypothetical protein
MTPRRLARRDGGQVTAFAVVMMAALILAAGLVLDGGLTLAARERALGEAQQAARAGAQAVNLTVYRAGGKLILSPGQAVADGRAYLAGIGAVGTVTVTGNTVTATVTITQDMQILDVAGLRSITVHATASAVPDFGIERISGEFANSEGPFAGNPRAGASGD